MKLPFQLGRYTLVHRIGVGAFGQVYRAEVRGDMGFVSDFAVKVLEANVVADNPNVAHQLADEAHILSQLDHPNIVKVVDFKHIEHSVLGDVYFMVMECVRGIDVATLQSRQRSGGRSIPATAVLHMGLMVSDALAHAHSLESREGTKVSIVHRDLKPQNLMVNFRGQVKVLDFGIAKATHDDRLAQRTQEGQTKGTVFYMSPEQLAGDPLDGRSDIYSLGTILFELLLGTRLLDVEVNTAAELVRAMHTAFEMDIEARLSVLRTHLKEGHNGDLSPEATEGWLGLLRAALQKDCSYRQDSAAVFSQQLERLRALHPPAENRNFWAHEVEAASSEQQGLSGDDHNAKQGPPESVPEDSSTSGSGTNEFFGIGTGEITNDEVPGQLAPPETVPLTRGMGVVTGTVRSFGSEVVQRLGPISRSQPALGSSPNQDERTVPYPGPSSSLAEEEGTVPYVATSSSSPQEESTVPYVATPEAAAPGPDVIPAFEVDGQQLSQDEEETEGQHGASHFSGDDTGGYEITVTDTKAVESGSYRQQKPRRQPAASRKKPARLVVPSGLLSALLGLGLVGLIIWSATSGDHSSNNDSNSAPVAIETNSSEIKIVADEARNDSVKALSAGDEPSEATVPQQANDAETPEAATADTKARNDRKAPQKATSSKAPEDSRSSGATRRSSGSKAAPIRSAKPTTSARQRKSSSPRRTTAPKATSATTSKASVGSSKASTANNPDTTMNADGIDESKMGLVRLVARPRCKVIRYECPCPWAKARTAPPDNGIALGTTDETRKGIWLPAGTHRIRFICDDKEECKGFANQTGGKTITVEAGKKHIFQANFYEINEGAQK